MTSGLKALATGVCALALIAPSAAFAQRGGGGHGGGGFHGGGFHGGGGFYHGGYGHGWGGHGWGRHGWGYGHGWGYRHGFYPYYGFGLGLGFGGLWAYDLYNPWYFPSYSTGWSAPYYDGGDYDYGGYDYDPAPPSPGGDVWSNEAMAEGSTPAPPMSVAPMPGSTSTVPPGTANCGRWSWSAAQSRYDWDTSAC